jgi:membrane-associated phospholipid phosphatase
VSRRSGALLAAAFAALAGLTAAGAFTRLDQWAVDHAMPGASFSRVSTSLLTDVIPLYHVRWHSPWSVATNLVTLPASFLLSLVIVAALSRRLGLALLACVAVEVICKETLTRPALYHGFGHIEPFDSSFPSGHALRTVLIAVAVASVWPRLTPAASAWATASVVLLLLGGWHTPSDLVGGVGLGGLAAVVAVPRGRTGSPRCGVLGRPASTASEAPCVLASRRPAHPRDEHHRGETS